MRSGRVPTVTLFVVSVVYLLGALQISTPEGQYAAVGPGAFPLAIGLGLVCCSLWMGLRPDRGPRVVVVDWRAGALSAAVFLIYLILLDVVGYLAATAPFIMIESRLLGSRAWKRDLIVSVAITASVYALFQLVLGFRLPTGLFG